MDKLQSYGETGSSCLAVVDGDVAVETALHNHFADIKPNARAFFLTFGCKMGLENPWNVFLGYTITVVGDDDMALLTEGLYLYIDFGSEVVLSQRFIYQCVFGVIHKI